MPMSPLQVAYVDHSVTGGYSRYAGWLANVAGAFLLIIL